MNYLAVPTRRSNIKDTHTANKFYCRFVVVVVLTYYTKLLVRKKNRCKLLYDRVVQFQVVHNRGHGFSKRFNLAGVPKCTQTFGQTLSRNLHTCPGSLAKKTSPRSHLTKLNPYREFSQISETDLAVGDHG
jgi:hypothetical protein